MSKGLTRGLAKSLIADAHGRSQVPDFETRSPPEPGRFEKILASTVAALRRLGATAVGLLRGMNRHRWATGLVVLFAMVLASGFVAYRQEFAPEVPQALAP
jgi:hypothetical protein